MVLSYYTGENITPDTIAQYSLSKGCRTSYEGTSWALFNIAAEDYDLEFYQTGSSQEALNWLNNKEDALVICSMGPGLWTSGGHFILVWQVVDGKVYINDPATNTRQDRLYNSFNYMAGQCKQYFCFNKQLPIIEEEEQNIAVEEPQNLLALSFANFLKEPQKEIHNFLILIPNLECRCG